MPPLQWLQDDIPDVVVVSSRQIIRHVMTNLMQSHRQTTADDDSYAAVFLLCGSVVAADGFKIRFSRAIPLQSAAGSAPKRFLQPVPKCNQFSVLDIE